MKTIHTRARTRAHPYVTHLPCDHRLHAPKHLPGRLWLATALDSSLGVEADHSAAVTTAAAGFGAAATAATANAAVAATATASAAAALAGGEASNDGAALLQERGGDLRIKHGEGPAQLLRTLIVSFHSGGGRGESLYKWGW